MARRGKKKKPLARRIRRGRRTGVGRARRRRVSTHASGERQDQQRHLSRARRTLLRRDRARALLPRHTGRRSRRHASIKALNSGEADGVHRQDAAVRGDLGLHVG